MRMEGEQAAFELSGEKVRSYLIDLLTSDVEALERESPSYPYAYEHRRCFGVLTCLDPNTFVLTVPAEAGLAASWMGSISDGYIAMTQTLPSDSRHLAGKANYAFSN